MEQFPERCYYCTRQSEITMLMVCNSQMDIKLHKWFPSLVNSAHRFYSRQYEMLPQSKRTILNKQLYCEPISK